MDLTELLNIDFLAVVLFATLIAMVFNWIDPPTTKLSGAQAWAVAIIGTLIAAFISGWAALDSGTDIWSFTGFSLVVGGALGGIVGARGALHLPSAIQQINAP